MNLIKRYKYPFYIILFDIICVWPLAFFVYIPKWDSIDQYLPLRFFISDFIHNGHFPFWSPFQHMGEMPYSDLQSGCWYPILWLLIVFGKYTITSLSIEVVLTFIIAGLGFYKVGKELFKADEKISFILAISYSLSGFMVGSAQLLTFLIGIAFLPWIIYALLKLLKTPSLRYSGLLATFMALNTTGAAPQFTLVISYFLFLVFSYKLITSKEKKKLIYYFFVFTICYLTLISPFVLSFLDFLPYSLRDGKIPYNEFYLSNSFTIKEWLSFIFPFSTISETNFFNPTTDLTLRNGYFGIVGLLFFGSSFFNNSVKKNKWLFITALLFLILAMGGETFIYRLLYYLPGFGTFRHASFYKVYFIFVALIIAGSQLKEIQTKHSINKKLPFIILCVLLFISIFCFFNSNLNSIKNIISTISHFKEGPYNSIYVHIFINSSFLVILTSLFLLIYKKRGLVNALIVVTVLDLFFHVNLLSPRTIVSNISFAKTKDFFNELPNDIQQPNFLKLKYFNEKEGLKGTEGFWRNLSMFNKTISYLGHNPTQFKNYHIAELSGKLSLAIENELIYFPEKKYNENDSISSGYVWGPNSKILFEKEKTSVNSINIGYNSFRCNLKNESEKSQWLVLNQNYHHLWKAYLNGTPLQIQKINDFVMGVKIPEKSEGILNFNFESNKIIYFAGLSILLYLVIITYSLYTKINSI